MRYLDNRDPLARVDVLPTFPDPAGPEDDAVRRWWVRGLGGRGYEQLLPGPAVELVPQLVDVSPGGAGGPVL